MTARVTADGKQFRRGPNRFPLHGVTYGTFAPQPNGDRSPDQQRVKLDLAAMRSFGFNVVRPDTEPSSEMWRVDNPRKSASESLHVFPLSNRTELDVWQYIHVEQIPVVPLYFAAPRPVRERVHQNEFLEVHVHAPLAVVESRNPKGLYRKARSGQLTNFTGIDAPYEEPESPELRLDTTILSPDDSADAVVRQLASMRIFAS